MTRFLTSKREEDRETAELIRSLRADNERLRRDLAERDRQLSESVTDETELQRELAEARNRQSCDNGQPWICHALATARSELAEADKVNQLLRADLAAAAREEDLILIALRLDPERYRTECGYLNVPKIVAAIKNPDMYPHAADSASGGA